MAKFLNTSATNYYLEELIKTARERLIIISPFLKINDRMRELLEDKDRMKLDIRIIFGKSELAPKEINWLRSLTFVRTSFCQNLHAKSYINERYAIITSMNLYDFSQINNNEMGVLIARGQEDKLYRDTFDEAQRLIRISEEVRLSAETIEKADEINKEAGVVNAPGQLVYEKLTTSKLAKSLGMRTGELNEKLVDAGLLERDGDQLKLTAAGKESGGEFRFSKKFGPYFLWPAELNFR
jgi:phosphatidylserine/phosphatidylglycerophosphate/cardiolipin synthase-like enzyme